MKGLLIFVLVLLSQIVIGQDWVVGIVPVANATEISPDQPIEIKFKAPIQTENIDESLIIVYGEKSGHHTFIHHWDASQLVLKLFLQGPFVPGEKVQIGLNPSMLPAEQTASRDFYFWSYSISNKVPRGISYAPFPNYL